MDMYLYMRLSNIRPLRPCETCTWRFSGLKIDHRRRSSTSIGVFGHMMMGKGIITIAFCTVAYIASGLVDSN